MLNRQSTNKHRGSMSVINELNTILDHQQDIHEKMTELMDKIDDGNSYEIQRISNSLRVRNHCLETNCCLDTENFAKNDNYINQIQQSEQNIDQIYNSIQNTLTELHYKSDYLFLEYNIEHIINDINSTLTDFKQTIGSTELSLNCALTSFHGHKTTKLIQSITRIFKNC